MGEEEKKEEKKGETAGEIILKVDMHCEGCVRKVKRSLRGFEGVEEIQADTKTHRVVVKGKAADPLKICQRIEKKSGRKVELISPSPKSLEEAKKAQEKQAAKQEEENEKKEEPAAIVAVLDVHMHCENCSQEIRRIIEKMKGVQSADPDLKSKQVTVRGAFDPASLVAYLHRRTGKHAAVVKQEVEKKEEKVKEEKEKKAGKGGGSGEGKDDKAESAGAAPAEKKAEKKNDKKEASEVGVETKAEAKKSEAPTVPKYSIEYVHAPQIFSDENPNACAVM